jgi:hypothetical protein
MEKFLRSRARPVLVAENFTDISEPIVKKMSYSKFHSPLLASTACYGDSIISFNFTIN